jgi:hypothetical protein
MGLLAMDDSSHLEVVMGFLSDANSPTPNGKAAHVLLVVCHDILRGLELRAHGLSPDTRGCWI